MDPSKAMMKNVGSKLTDEHEGGAGKEMAGELANLGKLIEKKELPVIKIQEKDIKMLQNELDITYEEAKLRLIKAQGDPKVVINNFLNDFHFEEK